MLVLNEQVKPKDVIFNAEPTIKNINKKDNKNIEEETHCNER